MIRRRRHSAGSSSFLDDSAGEGIAGVGSGGELEWPFGHLDTLDRDEIRETAYEIFFTSCRSSPGFASSSAATNTSPSSPAAVVASSRSPLPYYHYDSASSSGVDLPPKAAGGGTGMMVVNSRVKRELGLRTRRAQTMRAMSHLGSSPLVPAAGGGAKARRPMTSAEIMRQQMGVTEHSDNRLRKTLTRSLVGQMSKRVETIVLPLELLRHLKTSEFGDISEYHQWQRRQLKILEVGLLLHPLVPLERLNSAGLRFSDIMRASEHKPIDTTKNSEGMRALSNCVMALSWRSHSGVPIDMCHWADGYPLNIHLYLALLQSIFDLRDETIVLDEVDELLELMKRTWNILGINRMVHNVCFAWILFEQYVTTGQVEPDLISGTLVMLVEVANDAKRPDREPGYVRVLSAALASMQGWAEKKLLDYHEWFDKGSVGAMENVLCLALSVSKIIIEDLASNGNVGLLLMRENNVPSTFSSQSRVDHYIRSSMKSVFTKVLENGNGKVDSMVVEVDEDPCETLLHLAKEAENLALIARETYSSVLKRWHPVPTAIAAVTLHGCFGAVLKQYVGRISGLTNELVRVLQTAGKLEKVLVQIVVDDSADCEHVGKSIIKEIIPYDVDSIVLNLMKNWISERLRAGRECLNRAKETESWNPKSKQEPYAQSAMDLMKLAKSSVDEFFEIQAGARDELVQDLADGLDSLFQDCTTFVASCGSKQIYVPKLPPLTRCNQDSRVLQLWKKAATPCKAGIGPSLISVPCKTGIDRSLLKPVRRPGGAGDITHHPRPMASRGTQRLYVRLNTLQYLLSILHSIDKSLSFFSRNGASASPGVTRRRMVAPTHFDQARASINSSILHVAEVAAFRLIFHDSSQTFYDTLYLDSVSEARIRPTIRTMKQNLSLLSSLLTDRAQPLAVREVMKASFEAFMLVILAGGSSRAFARGDHDMVMEDFTNLKRLFCSSGEGFVSEDVVEKEAGAAEGVVSLMGLPTEKLVEEFSFAACEASGLGRSLERVPMPPATGKWHRSDPHTMLRVLCHRNDDVANRFLKRTFDLPKRK